MQESEKQSIIKGCDPFHLFFMYCSLEVYLEPSRTSTMEKPAYYLLKKAAISVCW